MAQEATKIEIQASGSQLHQQDVDIGLKIESGKLLRVVIIQMVENGLKALEVDIIRTMAFG